MKTISISSIWRNRIEFHNNETITRKPLTWFVDLILTMRSLSSNTIPNWDSPLKMSLKDKTAVLLGGLGGIGFEIGKHLLKNGISVILNI